MRISNDNTFGKSPNPLCLINHLHSHITKHQYLCSEDLHVPSSVHDNDSEADHRQHQYLCSEDLHVPSSVHDNDSEADHRLHTVEKLNTAK